MVLGVGRMQGDWLSAPLEGSKCQWMTIFDRILQAGTGMAASVHPDSGLVQEVKMEQMQKLVRDLLAVAGVFALGYWVASGRTVQASSDDVQFALQGVNESSSLLVYQPATKTVYVYRAAMVGNSTLQCSFKFEMTKPGEIVRRENCPVHSFQ